MQKGEVKLYTPPEELEGLNFHFRIRIILDGCTQIFYRSGQTDDFHIVSRYMPLTPSCLGVWDDC